jgi:hypothetical protein
MELADVILIKQIKEALSYCSKDGSRAQLSTCYWGSK